MFYSENIYLVITPFFPSQNSFRGSFILDQVKAIQNNSEFKIYIFKPKTLFSRVSDYEFKGIKVFHFNIFELPSNLLPGLFYIFAKKSFVNKLSKVAVPIEKIAIVHCHSFLTGYFANYLKHKMPGIKTVLQYHGLDVLGLKKGKFKNIKWNQKWIIRLGQKICNPIDLHVGVSQATLSAFNSYPQIMLKNKYVLYNGVDTQKFYPKKENTRKEYFNVGCIGNFIALKDQITLIRAVEIIVKSGINDIMVNFIGSGPTLEYCKSYISQNKLDEYFSFLSEVQHEELNSFYNSLDLFVLPSYFEALGCVYLEAFSCGVPFIAVKRQGISEYIFAEDKKKWLIEPSDFKTLAKMIVKFRKTDLVQKLKYPININILIKNFITKIESL